jgi:peptidoglycan/LPS O-acetylase OafA/YrhL
MHCCCTAAVLQLNNKPNRLGKVIIGAAYGVYLIHPPFVAAWGRALAGQQYPAFLVNVCALAPLVTLSCWVVAVGMRAVPGVDRVL